MIDSFLDSIHVFYDTNERCEAVEFYRPQTVSLQSHQLLGSPYSEVKRALSKMDQNIDDSNGHGFVSVNLGVGIYAQLYLDDPSVPTQAVIAFVPGYYDD